MNLSCHPITDVGNAKDIRGSWIEAAARGCWADDGDSACDERTDPRRHPLGLCAAHHEEITGRPRPEPLERLTPS